MQLNVGVIGAGVMGEYHTKIYSQMHKKGLVNFIGVADIDGKRGEEVAGKYGCKSFVNYTDLIESGIDAVSICVPTKMHKEIVLDCTARGVYGILVEKPIADNLDDAMELIKSAGQKGVKLLIGHVERFNPAVLKMKEIIDSGKLGDIVSISATRVGPFPPRVKNINIIIDLAVHDIDVISYLYGEYPIDVYAIGGEDRASIIMKFSKGRAGIIETNWLTPLKVRKLDIVGLKGVADVNYIDQMIRIYGYEMVEEIKFVKEEPLMRELDHFIDIVKNGGKPLVTGKDGIQALKIALVAIESNKIGNVVGVG